MGLKQWASAFLRKLSAAPKHINRPYWARVNRNAHLKRREARRVSFRRYWRQNSGAAGLRYIPSRRSRRRLVHDWWKADQHYKEAT